MVAHFVDLFFCSSRNFAGAKLARVGQGPELGLVLRFEVGVWVYPSKSRLIMLEPHGSRTIFPESRHSNELISLLQNRSYSQLTFFKFYAMLWRRRLAPCYRSFSFLCFLIFVFFRRDDFLPSTLFAGVFTGQAPFCGSDLIASG